MSRVSVYTASRAMHAAKWRQLRTDGFNVISTWIDEADVGETCELRPNLARAVARRYLARLAALDWRDLWTRSIGEAARADLTVVYREAGERLKGALVEAGAALASGKSVWFVGPVGRYNFVHHPRVEQMRTLEELVFNLRGVDRGERGLP